MLEIRNFFKIIYLELFIMIKCRTYKFCCFKKKKSFLFSLSCVVVSLSDFRVSRRSFRHPASQFRFHVHQALPVKRIFPWQYARVFFFRRDVDSFNQATPQQNMCVHGRARGTVDDREWKGERVRNERIFGKKDSVGTWGDSARVGFREEETVRACLRMIINARWEGGGEKK